MFLQHTLYRSNIEIIRIVFFMLLLFNCSSNSGGDSIPSGDTIPPSAPLNLVSYETTQTTTDLSWTASTDNIGVKNYSIYQDEVNVSTTQNTSFTISGLNANTTYSFKVKANDNAGNTSDFSNSVSATTLEENTELLFASGDIENYIGDLIDNVPGSYGDDYKIPTSTQLDTWDLILNAILSENISEAVLKSSEVNYQITEFTETSISPNQVFYILEEKSSQSNYWGTYVFSKTPIRGNLILMAPHIKYDINTGKQAIYCFKNNIAKAAFINGTHRCNNSEFSLCSGITSACSSESESYRVSDFAHNTNSIFQRSTENLFNNIPNSVFIQLHGFGQQASDPFVIMSNGTRETPAVDYATLIKDALLLEDGSLTFKLAHIDTGWTRLIGFTNTQGRLINNSADHCSTSATTTTGRFIHIEQEKAKLRDDATGWAKMSNALGNVFN